MKSPKLPRSFYTRPDVTTIARELIGKTLCTRLDGKPVSAGIIVETEAYSGRNDRACHANNGRRTKRTEIMYHEGGVAYVYLCYGIHHLFNVVTNGEGNADAVLVRALKPVDGIKTMLQRRDRDNPAPELTAGPGRLTEALGITTDHYGKLLTGNSIWIENRETGIDDTMIESGPRIGVDYAGQHAERPWRFYVKNSEWVSR